MEFYGGMPRTEAEWIRWEAGREWTHQRLRVENFTDEDFYRFLYREPRPQNKEAHDVFEKRCAALPKSLILAVKKAHLAMDMEKYKEELVKKMKKKEEEINNMKMKKIIRKKKIQNKKKKDEYKKNKKRKKLGDYSESKQEQEKEKNRKRKREGNDDDNKKMKKKKKKKKKSLKLN